MRKDYYHVTEIKQLLKRTTRNMKKFLIGSVSVLLIAIAVFIGVATVYFKPFIKEQILTQLAAFGYQDATIGDISVGLYKSSINEIDLKKSGQNTIGEIAVTYWPQQLLNKEIDTIQIKDGTIQVSIESNGDVVAAGYRIPSALKPKTNDNIQKAAATADGQTAPSAFPFSEIVITNFKFTITTPSNKTVSGIADATYNMAKKSAKGKLNLDKTDAVALQEIARIAKPDVANMVTNLSGKVSGDVDFEVPNLDDMSRIPGQGTIVAEGVNFTKDDLKINNLNTTMKIESLAPFSIANGQKVTIDTVNKSMIAVKNIATTFGLKESRHLTVDGANLDVAGGTITADAFKADIQNINTLINLTVKHVNLADFSKLVNIPAFNMAGELNGKIPVKFQNGRIVIDQAVVNTVIQNFAGEKVNEKINEVKEKANKKIEEKLNKELFKLNDKLMGKKAATPTPAPATTAPVATPIAPAAPTPTPAPSVTPVAPAPAPTPAAPAPTAAPTPTPAAPVETAPAPTEAAPTGQPQPQGSEVFQDGGIQSE